LNNDPKSTTEMRIIAQDVMGPQIRVCEVQRDRINDRQAMLVEATTANARAVAALSEAVAALTVTVTQLASTVATQAATDATQAEINATQERRLGKLETQQAVFGVKMGALVIAGSNVVPLIQWVVSSLNH